MYRDALGQKRRNNRVAGIENDLTFWHGGTYGLPPQPAKNPTAPGKAPAVAAPKPAEQIAYGIAEADKLGDWAVADANAVKTQIDTSETAYVTYVTQSGEERRLLARKIADERKQLAIDTATVTANYLNAAATRAVTALTTFATAHPSPWATEALNKAQAAATELASTTTSALTDATNQANATQADAHAKADGNKQKAIDKATQAKQAALNAADAAIVEITNEWDEQRALALKGLYVIVDLPWEPRPGADLPEAPFTLDEDILDYAPRAVDTWFASIGTPDTLMILSQAGGGGLPYSLIGSASMFVRTADDGGDGGLGPNGTNRTAARTSAGRRDGESLSQGLSNVSDETYAQQTDDTAKARLKSAAQQEVTITNGEGDAQFPDVLAPSQKKPGQVEPPAAPPTDAGIVDPTTFSGPANLSGVIDRTEPPWMDSIPSTWFAQEAAFELLSRLSDLSHLACPVGMSPYTTVMWYDGQFRPQCGIPFTANPLGVQFNVGISDPLAATLAVELLVQMAEVVEKLAVAVADAERLAGLAANPDGPWIMEDANRFRYSGLLAAKRGEIESLQSELDRLMQEFVDLTDGETLIAISAHNDFGPTSRGMYRPTTSIEALIAQLIEIERQPDVLDHGIESFPLAEYIAGSVAGFVRLALAKATARAFAVEAAETAADAAIDLVDPTGVGSLARGAASGLPGRRSLGPHPGAGLASEAVPRAGGRIRAGVTPPTPGGENFATRRGLGRPIGDSSGPRGVATGPDDDIPDGFSFDVDKPKYRRFKSGNRIIEYTREGRTLSVDWVEGGDAISLLRRILDAEGRDIREIIGYASRKLDRLDDNALLRYGRLLAFQLGGEWTVTIRKELGKRYLVLTR